MSSTYPDNEPADFDGPVMDHAPDGIHEYDNPLPGWWKWLFIATIAFACFYFYIDVTTDYLSAGYAYDQAVIDDTARQFGKLKLTPDAATLLKLGKDEKLHALGASIFQTNCVSCHGRHAEGIACPNLTAGLYIHVRKIADFVDVITHGANNGAMPAWGNRLRPNEIICVAAYVASLRGTNYPGGRAPFPNAIPVPPWSDK
ncbi:MAG TPA: cbb3-type cytochrome c oxidase N-terminal domain-containing protein [Tepidisphaeraceae bacterium]|nr:cbb3-type cytochrome c oxidase N-terminal domain-containing protein [Tepidisphaeraceae bacterium]